jgi:hypothetical protein
VKDIKRYVEHIQSYIPFIMKCGVPIMDSLFIILILAITVLSILKFLLSKPYLLKLEHCANKWTTISFVLLVPISVLYASFLIIVSAADISPALEHGYHFSFVLVYLYFFLPHMFNSFYSWATGSSREVVSATATSVGISSAIGNAAFDATDRGITDRYINERSISMRDQFANNLNEGQAYLYAVAIGQGYESIDQWIEKHARDAAIKEAQSIKRENRDLGSSHE